mmetsp:Transcript_44446/g.69495  ORF Transcript_44446/g.69495 Transcript_44446/m.69495 type:complete len:402 (-) Transcript_44446:92-1297(-)
MLIIFQLARAHDWYWVAALLIPVLLSNVLCARALGKTLQERGHSASQVAVGRLFGFFGFSQLYAGPKSVWNPEDQEIVDLVGVLKYIQAVFQSGLELPLQLSLMWIKYHSLGRITPSDAQLASACLSLLSVSTAGYFGVSEISRGFGFDKKKFFAVRSRGCAAIFHLLTLVSGVLWRCVRYTVFVAAFGIWVLVPLLLHWLVVTVCWRRASVNDSRKEAALFSVMYMVLPIPVQDVVRGGKWHYTWELYWADTLLGLLYVLPAFLLPADMETGQWVPIQGGFAHGFCNSLIPDNCYDLWQVGCVLGLLMINLVAMILLHLLHRDDNTDYSVYRESDFLFSDMTNRFLYAMILSRDPEPLENEDLTKTVNVLVCEDGKPLKEQSFGEATDFGCEKEFLLGSP